MNTFKDYTLDQLKIFYKAFKELEADGFWISEANVLSGIYKKYEKEFQWFNIWAFIERDLCRTIVDKIMEEDIK